MYVCIYICIYIYIERETWIYGYVGIVIIHDLGIRFEFVAREASEEAGLGWSRQSQAEET